MHYIPKRITADPIKLQFVIMIFPFHSSPPPPPAPPHFVIYDQSRKNFFASFPRQTKSINVGQNI